MYWKQIPISEPPPKAGWYTMINSPHFIQVNFYWDGVWKNNEYDKEQSDLSMGHTHYLVPITDEEIKKIASDVWDAGSASAYDCVKPEGACGFDRDKHAEAKTDYLNSIK
jgi:hypothetical protein